MGKAHRRTCFRRMFDAKCTRLHVSSRGVWQERWPAASPCHGAEIHPKWLAGHYLYLTKARDFWTSPNLVRLSIVCPCQTAPSSPSEQISASSLQLPANSIDDQSLARCSIHRLFVSLASVLFRLLSIIDQVAQPSSRNLLRAFPGSPWPQTRWIAALTRSLPKLYGHSQSPSRHISNANVPSAPKQWISWPSQWWRRRRRTASRAPRRPSRWH